MKKKIIIIIIGISCLTGIIPAMNPSTASAQVSVSYQVFYDQLSPFGTWVNYPGYGYVWVPGAGSGFRPYGTRGHWVYTDEGWTWASDYSWGWATFHYGNWFYDNSYGWLWQPGYQWAPAWVTWGEYGGNYCWAPIGPNINIGVSFGTYRPPYNYWNFCPYGHITSVNVSNYYVTNIRNSTTISHITVINNVNRSGGGTYLRGPAPASVERYTHTTIHPLAIQAASRPGTATVGHGQLAIYRPAVQADHASAKPAAVRDLHSLRPVNKAPAFATSKQAHQPATATHNPTTTAHSNAGAEHANATATQRNATSSHGNATAASHNSAAATTHNNTATHGTPSTPAIHHTAPASSATAGRTKTHTQPVSRPNPTPVKPTQHSAVTHTSRPPVNTSRPAATPEGHTAMQHPAQSQPIQQRPAQAHVTQQHSMQTVHQSTPQQPIHPASVAHNQPPPHEAQPEHH